MIEQVRDAVDHLKPGAAYLFAHQRKGNFVARFTKLVPTHEGDPADSFYIEVDIYVADGSGQERLANTFIRDDLGRKVRPQYEPRRIRPSLLTSITAPSTNEQELLRQRFDIENQRAVEHNDVDTSRLPFPTAAAVGLLSPEPEKASGHKAAIAAGAIAAASGSAGILAHLLGVF